MDQQKKKKNSTFRKTLYGTGIGLVIWTALVGVMLTNPQVKSTNPGVFQLVELVTPWLDRTRANGRPGGCSFPSRKLPADLANHGLADCNSTKIFVDYRY